MSKKPFSPLCSPSNLPELGMVKGLLASANINFVVTNEEYAALGPMTGFADKTATVMVSTEELAEAQALLETHLGYEF